ncbi:MAG: GNAT family N-acetyltransferase [Candidatus Omnitrophota bacterium]|jgi:RimJ/RimL family protein N-acetyltransferase
MKDKEKFYSTLIGPRLRLNPFGEEHITNRYLRWMNDPEVTRHLNSEGKPVTMDDLHKYCRSIKESSDNFLFAIELKEEDVHIGNIRLGPVDWERGRTDMGIMIGDKDHWGKGYGAEALYLLMEFAFDRLLLKEFVAGARSLNERARRLYRKTGFKLEKVIKGTYVYEGKEHDAHYFCMTNEEFCGLRKKKDFILNQGQGRHA